MATWLEDVVSAISALGGVAPLRDIYDRTRQIRPEPHPQSLDAIIRRTIESNSSDSEVFNGDNLFYSVNGIGGGVWGLRSMAPVTPHASDIEDRGESALERVAQDVYRVLRDTELARVLKRLHDDQCQLCGCTLSVGADTYSEAHHIKPLGSPHHGPDVAGNRAITKTCG